MSQATAATPALLTAEEFIRRHAHEPVELVAGKIEATPMPTPRHGRICTRVSRHLDEYAESHDHGHVMSNDSFIRTRRGPDSLRGADVCYYTFQRLAKGPVPEGVLDVVPDLAVEVRSPSDTWSATFIKVGEYLAAGVTVVVVLDPDTATASVYRENELQQIFDNGDDLVIADVLPGFSVPVRKLFE